MMFKRIIMIFSILILASCSQNEIQYRSLAPGSPTSISLVHLIVDPLKYHNKEIEVSGYLGPFPAFSLFLTKEHFNLIDFRSSIQIADLPLKERSTSDFCGGNYATVQGKIKKTSSGSLYITDLRRIMILTDNGLETCWPVKS